MSYLCQLAWVVFFAAVSCVPQKAEQSVVLFDFENEAELDRFGWKCRSRFELSDHVQSSGKRSLRFDFYPAKRVGFSTGDVPRDWAPYDVFSFWVNNPQETTVVLNCRISRSLKSRQHDFISRQFEVSPGASRLSIDLGNVQKIKDIGKNELMVDGFYVYMENVDRTIILYFDEFRLERNDKN